MKKRELARLFYRELLKIHQNEAYDLSTRLPLLNKLLQGIFLEATQEEHLHFTTLFARIAYTCHKFQLSRQQQFHIHNFRRTVRNLDPQFKNEQSILQKDYEYGLLVISDCIAHIFQEDLPEKVQKICPAGGLPTFHPVDVQAFRYKVRVAVLEKDEQAEQLIATDEAAPGRQVRIQYNIVDRNENFNPSIKLLGEVFSFPVTLNLIDVEIDQDGVYHPRAFVIEPDYLVDVTAIAECFKSFGTVPQLYLLKKFIPFQITKYLMIGHIANFFLDELMNNPEAEFKETFPKVFRLNPLAFATFDNQIMKEIYQKSQLHWVNLKRVIHQELAQEKITAAHCFLEPTFYSEQFGIQGRLDVWYQDPENGQQSAIIELKSGKAWKPNKYGISDNHFTQTLLYDLLIKSVFGPKTNSTNFILYSAADQRQLRFAPVIKAQQYEAIQIRNQLIGIEWQLTQLTSFHYFDRLHPHYLPQADGFIKRDVEAFARVFRSASTLEKTYFSSFAGMIAREHQLAKTGVQGMENINGQAQLWLNNLQEKEESFELLGHLRLKAHQTSEEEPLLHFSRTDQTNPLANFRNGDIAIVYPADSASLSNQLFKCTIIAIDRESVSVRLRSKQLNTHLFEKESSWNIEHDLLDTGFISMYRNLFQFLQSDRKKKELLLGTRPPAPPTEQEVPAISELTVQQQDILQKAIESEDYFLLWGPPGTGKTSKMLKQLVAYLINYTTDNILLLAYTNRAVDEICEAIESIGPEFGRHYLRIGSRYATPQKFQDKLLARKIERITTRQELRQIIDAHRLVVGTVASIAGKPQLFQLKQFDRAIIDEASQILEPNLVGLLPHFQHFTLIGDHKQLPAVVVQDEAATATTDTGLNEIGLYNLRNSLFERLLHRCQRQKWHWAYARLSQQGRMHRDIMAFPNTYFYKGALQILPEDIPLRLQQLERIKLKLPSGASDLEKLLVEHRLLFLPTPVDPAAKTTKTNSHEAKMIGQLVRGFIRIYESNDYPLNENTIGIITPFRSQIATIRETLHELQIDPDHLTIDTVERYQGGARDIILISLCTNAVSQLNTISSFDEEGIDRKLNVALTRARGHLVLVGNPSVLRANPVYKSLIRWCQELVD